MPSVFDLHIHTIKGSGDSSLSPLDLVKEAQRIGLQGACLTEHSGWQDRHDFERFAREQDVVLVRAREIDTNMGHILAFGLDGYLPGVMDIRELRRAVQQVGGFMIAAHPFRYLFTPPGYYTNLLYPNGDSPQNATEAAGHPLFELVDEVEAVNGANVEKENLFTLEVVRRLGRRGTGGSDAHSVQGIGRGVTVFEDEVRSEAEFLEALRSGRFRPAEGFNTQRPRFFDEEVGELSGLGRGPDTRHL